MNPATNDEGYDATLIPAGRHKGRAVEADFGLTKTGNEQIAVLFEIADGPSKGQTITWYGFFTETTDRGGKTLAERTIDSLRACGCTFPKGNLGDLTGLDANEIVLVIEHEQDQQGQARARVRFVNAPGVGLALGTRMDEGARRAFAMKMRGLVLSTGGAQAPANAQQAQRPAAQQQRPAAQAQRPAPAQQRTQQRPQPQPGPDPDDGFSDPGGDDDIPF